MPLTPGVRRTASAHLKQPRRQKPKPKDAPAVSTASATTNGRSSAADAPVNKSRGRKRKSAESAGNDEAAVSPAEQNGQHGKASKPPAGKGTKRRGKKNAGQEEQQVGDDSATGIEQERQDTKLAAKGSRGRTKGAKGTAQEPDELCFKAVLQMQDDLAASLADSQQVSSGPQPEEKTKRVGDIELENQLAMAMASTAAEAQHKAQRKPTARAVHNEPMPSAFSPRSGGAKPTLGETWARDARLANQDLAQSDAANHWTEVFCGSAELGKWIHADPLLDWLDVPDKVEGAGIRYTHHACRQNSIRLAAPPALCFKGPSRYLAQ